MVINMSENKEENKQGMEKKEKKPHASGIKKSFASRQFRSGAYSSLITVIVIALVVIINLAFGKLDLSTDLTSDSLFTLSKETKNILKDVKDDVTVYYMVAKGEEQDYIQRVLKQYNKVSDHVKMVRKDPVIYPNFAKKYVDDQVSQNDVIVVNEKTNAAKYISNGDMYYSNDYSYYGSSEQYLDVEGRVTSAIQKVLSTDVQKLYVVTGHGEQEMTPTLSDSLEKMNVEVESISLVTEQKIPEDCTLLLLDGPQKDLRESEKTVILDYLKNGGDAILMPGYVQEETPNLDEILDYYGVSVQRGVIYEGAGHYENYLNWIVPSINTECEIMSGFGANDYVVIGSSQSLKADKASSLRSSLTLTELLTTSKLSLLKVDPTSEKTEKEKGDVDGPFVVGIYAQEELDEETTKLAIIATNEVQDVLLQNVIGTMMGDSESDTAAATSIEAKNLSYSSVTMNVASQIIWAIVLIIIVPLGLLLTGFGIWFVRRRK